MPGTTTTNTSSQVATTPSLPPWPTEGQPYRPTQSAATSTTIAAPVVSQQTPMPVIVAGVLYFILAFLTAGLGALQLLAETGPLAYWNVAVAVFYGLIGYWISQRQHRGFSWGIFSAVGSVILGLIQAVSAPSLIVLLIPFYVVVAVMLWSNAELFNK